MENSNIVNIKAERIMAHPNNPRKNLGDLSELVESIKIHGIMQNLTVIPLADVDPDAAIGQEEEKYVTLIGHRRYAAGSQAGVTEFPCKIARGLSEREQMSIMLEENMQRADLTIWEQANGFQMMLDLGETEESIAEKTGFSKTTVRHRLNIAKLNQDILMKKEKDEAFQMSLTDLYALEQIEDIKIRDKILKEASNSRDLVWKAKNAVEEINREKVAAKIIEMLEEAGIGAAPKEYEKDQYSGKWETVEWISTEKAAPKRISKKKFEGCFYHKAYRSVNVIRKKDNSKEPMTEAERIQKEKDRNKKTIKAIAKEMTAQRKSFIRNAIAGKIEPLKDTEDAVKGFWSVIVDACGYMNKTTLMAFLSDAKDWWNMSDEEKEKCQAKFQKLSIEHQLMIGAFCATNDKDFTEWDGAYKKEAGELITHFTEILEKYGFSYAEEEQNKVMEGSHECYFKKEEPKDESA